MTKASDTNPHAKPERSRAEALIEWVRAQLDAGIVEATGNNDGDPARLYAGGRQEPWCGHFVAEAYRAIGYPLPGDTIPTLKNGRAYASVTELERLFRLNGWIVSLPVPGGLVFLSTRDLSDPSKSGGRHVDFVESFDGKWIKTIGGNVGNKVGRTTRSLNHPAISSFGFRP